MSYWVLDASGNPTTQAKRDVSDFITMISVTETPILSRLMTVQAKHTMVKTLQDELATADPANAYGYGADAPAAQSTTLGEVTNYIQRFMLTAKVNHIEQACQIWGVGKALQYEEAKVLKQIKIDLEARIVSDGAATAPTAANSFTGQMAGLSALITTNVDSTTTAVTEDPIRDLMATTVAAGGAPKDLYCNAGARKTINDITTDVTRFSKDINRLEREVNVYHCSFGPALAIHYHWLMANDVAGNPAQILILQMEYIRLRNLIAPDRNSLQDTGSGPSTYIQWATTIDTKAEKAHCKFDAITDT
jgi:hypothetical protein